MDLAKIRHFTLAGSYANHSTEHGVGLATIRKSRVIHIASCFHCEIGYSTAHLAQASFPKVKHKRITSLKKKKLKTSLVLKVPSESRRSGESSFKSVGSIL